MELDEVIRQVIDLGRRSGAVVTRNELLGLGAHGGQVTSLVRKGILVRHHPGVYVLGGTEETHVIRVRSAIKALRRRGHEAVASHHSAAWLQGLLDHEPDSVHITASTFRPLDGVEVHRSRHSPTPTATFAGVLCTSTARTLLDLAVAGSPATLTGAVNRALAQRLVRVGDLSREVASPANRGRPGTDRLRRHLAERGLTGPAPSVLESSMARVFERYNLPKPRPEVVAGPDGRYRIDYAYPAAMVAIELYGYSAHHSPEHAAADLRRQRRLTLDGWTILIFTWQDVIHHPERVASDIERALSGSSQRRHISV
ncbi:MAG: DUF559 domain-containing protein [Acidobacteriota bacterium]|nr:DUF559 domain-containing protein [Acidobacteriota bacterium]